MRAALATVVAALAGAAPAAAVTGGFGVSTALRSAPLGLTAGTANSKWHSCQAGDRSAQTRRLGRKFHVIACEQPPKSNLDLPSSIAKATAAALSVLG